MSPHPPVARSSSRSARSNAPEGEAAENNATLVKIRAEFRMANVSIKAPIRPGSYAAMN
jgi:hypothetical protein